tara:strand:- start:3330 stop:3527 length:198 start_codon:yes stop_codon:yes gene_type:complete
MMRKAFTEEQLAHMFMVADKVVDRANRNIPVDRWATTDEMKDFVLAYEWMRVATISLTNAITEDG